MNPSKRKKIVRFQLKKQLLAATVAPTVTEEKLVLKVEEKVVEQPPEVVEPVVAVEPVVEAVVEEVPVEQPAAEEVVAEEPVLTEEVPVEVVAPTPKKKKKSS